MNLSTENKNSYFLLKIEVKDEFLRSEKFQSELDDAVDNVLYAMNVKTDERENYKALKKDGKEHIYIFRTNNRKRKGQLNKFCERYLPDDTYLEFTTMALKLSDLPRLVNKLKKNKNYNLELSSPEVSKIDYDGSDIQVFYDSRNWHSWQRKIYNMIYEKSGKLKKPDDRTILVIVDFDGNSGKSSFFKYLYINDPMNIGRITYGTASQLRSAAINIGKKGLYIIDLARTKGTNDRQEDLLAVIEDLKSGFVFSPMYGHANELIMEPPHIVISANYLLDPGSLSKDRWKIYKITKDKGLGKENRLLEQKITELARKKLEKG